MKETDSPDPQALADEPFLARWSRLKQAPQPPAEVEPASSPEPLETPCLTDADMPPLESLDENSDYSGFLSPEVSEELRQLALGKLFRNACFNLCDGLDDYAEDYTRFEKLGGLMTADLRFRLEQEAKRLAQQEQPGNPAEEASGDSDKDPPLAEARDGANDHGGENTEPAANQAPYNQETMS